jgi:UDP-GlcNAc:undecaprenyl-phosphate GlcNAc-1-phosphate transferase
MGFDHYEAVVIIYSVQIALVVSAVFLPYESDWLILSIYLGMCATVFGLLILKERAHWQAHSAKRVSRLAVIVDIIKKHELSETLPVSLVAVGVSLLFIAVSLLARDVPSDISVASAMMALILLLYLFLRKQHDSLIAQAVSYVAAAFVVYLETRHMGPMASWADSMEFGFFAFLALIIGLMIRYGHKKSEFTTTPMDYLVIFIVLFAGFLLHNLPEKAYLGAMVVKLVIIFYGCELIFLYARGRQYLFNWLVLLSLSAIALKGAIS